MRQPINVSFKRFWCYSQHKVNKTQGIRNFYQNSRVFDLKVFIFRTKIIPIVNKLWINFGFRILYDNFLSLFNFIFWIVPCSILFLTIKIDWNCKVNQIVLKSNLFCKVRQPINVRTDNLCSKSLGKVTRTQEFQKWCYY